MAKRLAVKGGASRRIAVKSLPLNADIDDDMLAYRAARNIFNVWEDGGTLKPFFGLKNIRFNGKEFGEITKMCGSTEVAYFKRYDSEKKTADDMLVFYFGRETPLHYMRLYGEDNSLYPINYPPFTSVPNFINYRLNGEDCLIISSPTDSLVIWNGRDDAEVAANAPKVNSMCMHYERLFATDSAEGASLWFSDDLDPRNWNISISEAGYVELAGDKGKLLRVMSFLDYLYIFRSYGISRLTAFLDQTEFAVSELYNAVSRIYEKTVTFCGDRIMFLSGDGLCRFDGLSVSKIDTGIDSLLKRADLSGIESCYYEGKFYLALKIDFNDDLMLGCEAAEFVNNALIIYDTKKGRCMLFRGADICSMRALTADGESALIVAVREGGRVRIGQLGNSGEIFGNEYEKICRLEKWNYSHYGKLKLLKYVYLSANCAGTLKITADHRERIFTFAEKEGVRQIPINIVGEELGLEICFTAADGRVSSLAVEYEVIN